MKIIFLGTNGWYSTPTGDTPCILIDSKDQYVVFDAGNGIYKLDEYIKEEKPISLFISHFHLDHVSGLNTLRKLESQKEIDIYVGDGRRKDFEALVNPPFTISYSELKMKVRLHELKNGTQNVPFKVTSIEQKHLFLDHGYRIEIDGKIIAYTGDCGLSDGLTQLALNADVLISECNDKKVPEDESYGHVDPYQIAKIAKKSGVKKLILTHFGSTNYPTIEDREWAEKEARKIFPNTIAATDLLEYEL